MKKPLIIGTMMLVAALGYLSFFRESTDVEEAPARSLPVPVTVETALDRRQAKETVSFAGTVSAEGVAEIDARVSGTVIASVPAIGSWVREGTVLATIDDRTTTAPSYLGFRSQDVREAGLAVERAKKTYQEAKRDDDRDETHDSELAKDLAKSNLASAEAALRSIVDARTVRSPISGIVTGKDISVGDTVAEGSPLFTIESSGAKRIIRFFVNDRERTLLRPGMPVRILGATDDTEASDGKILRIASAADVDSRRFPVEAELSGTAAAGTVVSVMADIVRMAGAGNIILPVSAIAFGQSGETIFVRVDGRAKSVPVSVLRIEGELAEVAAPIDDTAEIVIGNAKRVKDGVELSLTER